MLKYSLIIICGFALLFSCGQSPKTSDLQTTKQSSDIVYEARRDTILLEKPHGSIYITNDTTVKYYEWLVPGRGSDDYTQIYRTEMQAVLDSNRIRTKHVSLGDLPREYAPLHFYNGNFYVYSPSDWMSHFNNVLTDSVIIRLETDPANFVDVIRGFERLSPASARFRITNYEDTRFLVIRIVDKKRGIAIWEYQDNNGKMTSRDLRVDVRKVKQFPMIICDCGDAKCGFDWDGFSEPDYDKLIREAH
jgi:hypothetical protein